MADATDDISERLERIKALTDKYLEVQNESIEARKLAERIRQEVDAARALIQPAGRPRR